MQNFLTPQTPFVESNPTTIPTLNPFGVNESAATFMQETQSRRSFLEGAGLTVPAVFAHMIDTFISSVPGLEADDAVESFLQEQFPSLEQFMQDNRQWIGMSGDVIGAFIPGTLAVKAVRSGGMAARLMQKSLGNRRVPLTEKRISSFLTSTGKPNSQLFDEVFQRGRDLASKGKVPSSIPSFRKMRQQAIGRSVGDVVIESVAADAAIAATMNSSDFLFPEEMSMLEHLAFLGAFTTIAGGVAYAGARFAMSRGLQRALGPAVITGQNPSGLNFNQLNTNIAGYRGTAMTMHAWNIDEFQGMLREARESGDTELAEGALQQISSSEAEIARLAEKAFRDSPVAGVTTSITKADSAPELTTVQAAIKKDPNSFWQLASLEEMLPDTRAVLEQRLANATVGARAELRDTKQQFNEIYNAERGKTKHSRTYHKRLRKLQEAQQNLDDISRYGTVVYELDGSVSNSANRATMWQDGSRPLSNLPEGAVGVKTGTLEAVANIDGSIDLPATVIPRTLDEAVDVSLEGTLGNPSVYAQAQGLTSIDKLRQTLKAPGASMMLKKTGEVISLQRRFRQSQFVAYAREAGDSEFSLTKRGSFDVPIVVARDDIYGITARGNILARASDSHKANSASFTELSFRDRTAAMDAIQRVIERVDGNMDAWEGMELRANSHWTQFDMAETLLRRHGSQIEGKVTSGGAPLDIDEIQYMSMAHKFREYQVLRNDAAAWMQLGGDTAHVYDNMDNVAKALNLPGDMSSTLRVFEQNRVDGRILPFESVFKNMDEFREAMKKTLDAESTEEIASTTTHMGSMLDLPRDRKIIAGLMRNEEPTSAPTKNTLRTATLAERQMFLQRLEKHIDKRLPPAAIVPATLGEMYAVPGALEAVKAQLPQVIHGINVSFGGSDQLRQFTGAAVTQAFRGRDIPGFTALDSIVARMEKARDRIIETMLDTNAPGAPAGTSRRDIFNRLVRRDAAGDLTMFSTWYNAAAKGWDIEDAVPITMADNSVGYQFQLKQGSKRNKDLWRQEFPDNPIMPENARMPVTDRAQKPVTISELAYQGVRSMDELQQQLLTEHNQLRYARGERPLRRKKFHLPARNLSKAHRYYLMDNAGKIVTVVGHDSPKTARQLASDEQRLSQIPLSILDEVALESHFAARGQAWHEMDDFSRPSRQTGPARGTSALQSIDIGTNEFKRLIDTTLRGFDDVAREARMSMFDPEIQHLKIKKSAAGFNKSNQSTVYDFILNRIAGTSVLSAEMFPAVARVYKTVQNSYDTILQGVFDNFLNQNSPRMAGRAVESWQQLNKKLAPQHNPFKDFNEFLERTHNIKAPPEMRQHMADLNAITAGLSIRLLDAGMMAINYLSLGVTIPPVIKAAQKGLKETSAEHLARIGAYGTTTPNGATTLSPMKAIVSGTHFMWSKEGQAIAEEASKLGLFDQFAAETVRIYSETGAGAIRAWVRNKADLLSKPTDWSERTARAISWMTNYKIGTDVMGMEKKAAMSWAHSQANSVIGDFRPTNRPAIFQGAAGMPLGLFTTYMWNFLQRIYSMIERADMPALVNQGLLQSTLFGVESMPGAEELINTFTSNYDGSENLVDRLNAAIGHEATEVLMNGTLANVTSLLGLTEFGEGVSVGPRASIGLPGQFGFGATSAAGVQMVQRLVRLANNSFDAIAQEKGIDVGRQAEIMAQANVWKFAGNAIELAQGYALDTQGNIIEEDTRTAFGVGSRVLGFKPLVTDELRQQNRQNRVTDRIRRELMQRLSDQLRSKFHRGKIASEDVEDALTSYVRAGGRPENFRNYFARQYVRGLTSKLDLEIAEAVRNSNDEARLGRLLFLAGD